MMTLIAGNWKMHGSLALAKELLPALAALEVRPGVTTAICPPAPLLGGVAPLLGRMALGAQDCHAEAGGAFTGDVSAAMLKEAGCRYVIVGHSERRQFHGETDAQVAAKAARALEAGLIPIICVGETLAQRESGAAQAVVAAQVKASLPPGASAQTDFVLAYEPVWAIGSGKTPSPDDIRDMHAAIAAQTCACAGLPKERVAVLYGGSVKAANAKAILSIPGVSGVLVGGASLTAEEFGGIMQAA